MLHSLTTIKNMTIHLWPRSLIDLLGHMKSMVLKPRESFGACTAISHLCILKTFITCVLVTHNVQMDKLDYPGAGITYSTLDNTCKVAAS